MIVFAVQRVIETRASTGILAACSSSAGRLFAVRTRVRLLLALLNLLQISETLHRDHDGRC